MLLILIQGCMTFSPETFRSTNTLTCADYGVAITGVPAGIVIAATPMRPRAVNEMCGLRFDVRGCMIGEDGIVRLYWVAGDTYAEQHEWCHAKNGAVSDF